MIQLVVVYDKIANTYSSPLAFNSLNEATRWFKVQIGKTARPTDYDLYFVGGFDENTGKLLDCGKFEYLTSGTIDDILSIDLIKTIDMKKVVSFYNDLSEYLRAVAKDVEVKENEKEE